MLAVVCSMTCCLKEARDNMEGLEDPAHPVLTGMPEKM
jgi:hypothetical protein